MMAGIAIYTSCQAIYLGFKGSGVEAESKPFRRGWRG